nr:hypothetical protein GCM10025730_06610 [Promicromonospora thailandica]
MADIGWSLSGIDTVRWRIQGGSLWRPPVTVRRDVLTLPGRHGVTVTGRPPVFDEPTVTLELLCEGNQADLEALANELLGILAHPALTLGRYSGGLVTSAPAQFVSLSPGEFVPDVGAFFTVSLAVPGVFMRGASADSAPVVVTDGATVTVATLAGSTGPVPDAVLRIRGAATSVHVVDVVTGTGLSWAGPALAATDYLFLHAATLTARRSTSATAWPPAAATSPASSTTPAPARSRRGQPWRAPTPPTAA